MKIDMSASKKNLSGKLIDNIIALVKANVNGGYYDHICYNETKGPISNSNLDVLYNSQKILHLIGNKRAKLKNRLDRQLEKFVEVLIK